MNNNIKRVTMFIMPVNDMPKMKEFYAQQMGFQITKEYRQEDARWWTSIKLDDDNFGKF